MKVLFDWDNPDLDYIYAMQRGIKPIVYSVCRVLHLRPKYVEEVYTETDKYVETVSKLNQMLGVETVFGIRDDVSKVKPRSVIYLREHEKDVRRHIHIGKRGPDRKRLWEPPLTQSMDTWHYDVDYYEGHKPILKEGELPIWHIDRPYRISTYIDFIYETKEKSKEKQQSSG